MAIYDREGAADRVGRSARTIKRWEERGWLTFTLGRVRESDLLDAEKQARKQRGGDRRSKGQQVKRIELDESTWPEGAVADERVYSLEITRKMRFDAEIGARWFAGEDVDPWVPCEPKIVEPPFDIETMTGTYLDVSRRAVQLNAVLDRNGIKAFTYYPHPLEPQAAR
ncbi:hypothetical protein SK224_05455 [Microbacterium sp. BG28]|uniref:hypothetical protein n=1 Tax=Microbacterium sp. BG28 TaxID=3097356 RepID=UPI002A5A4475|nr:hypothetical protein [Microbacterium sp. BG28]MDY0828571.1 hypothetical protein [Microbacterium sp. BG28]